MIILWIIAAICFILFIGLGLVSQASTGNLRIPFKKKDKNESVKDVPTPDDDESNPLLKSKDPYSILTRNRK